MYKKYRKKFISRITDHCPGPEELYDYFKVLTLFMEFLDWFEKSPELRDKYHHFLVHIWHSTIKLMIKKRKRRKGNSARLVAVYSREIEKKFGRDFDVMVLVKAGLLEMKGHFTPRKKCREFRIPDEIWSKACRIEDVAIKKAWKAMVQGEPIPYDSVNLVTGESIRQPVRHKLKTDDNFNLPDLVKDSIKAYKPCILNSKYVGRWVNSLEKLVRKSKKALKKLEKKVGVDDEQLAQARAKHYSLYQKYRNERNSQKVILGQHPVKLDIVSSKGDPLYAYSAAYKTQGSGRVTEIHGGFQNASRVFKSLMFKNVDNVFNWDLKGSQANILRYELEECGIDNTQLVEYLSDPDAKYTYADKIGVDEQTWKDVFYAIVFGAAPGNKHASVFDTLLEYFAGDKELAGDAQKWLLKHAKELIKSCSELREYIFSGKDKRYMYKHNLQYWQNACGMKYKKFGFLRLSKDKQLLVNLKTEETVPLSGKKKVANELKRKLAAHILQGMEAAFICHLTLLCDEQGILVYKNEHDGLITGAEIPEELVIEAGKRSGLKNPTLVLKPLASEKDLDKARKLTRIGKYKPKKSAVTTTEMLISPNL